MSTLSLSHHKLFFETFSLFLTLYVTLKKRAVKAEACVSNANVDTTEIRFILDELEHVLDVLGLRQVALEMYSKDDKYC